jgi:preprotein translocase subunit Sec63
MNPYAILGVSTNATDLEIKSAYRILAKRYHPDRRSPEASHDQIAEINHAYDILSDPEKRARYDRGFTPIFYEPVREDPVEAYKRAFKRKRWEKEKNEKETKLARRRAIYNVMRWMHVVILFFGVGVIINDWLTGEGFVLFHVVMSCCAGYICYQRECTDFAYRLSKFTLFLFVMTLLVTFG